MVLNAQPAAFRLIGLVALAVVTYQLRAAASPDAITLTIVRNNVTYRRGEGEWLTATPNLPLAPGDMVRTGIQSQAHVQFGERNEVRLGELTSLRIRQPLSTAGKSSLNLVNGILYLFSRSKAHELEVTTPSAVAALRGTEFVVEVGSRGETRISVFEGKVELQNAGQSIMLQDGDQGESQTGAPPHKTAKIAAIQDIQWTLFYPAVLYLPDLPLAVNEQNVLSKSMALYQQGDLLGALAALPANSQPASWAVHVFEAALELSVGHVEEAERKLATTPASPARRALEQMLAAVRRRDWVRGFPAPQTASEWLAESYYQQSKGELEPARRAARAAVDASPLFGFGWVRLAELEFSSGQTREAARALDRGLKLSPRHAQGHALRGFLLSAENSTAEARASFDRAIELDGALGNAWLGRGLSRIRDGELELGRQDLQVAVAQEPNQSIFHSYLAKAFSQLDDDASAARDLQRAHQLDPRDPTPSLYRGLQAQQQNRYGEAIDALRESVRLNDARRVYRSSFLLDQDRAVRSANLAAIYRATGMTDLSLREASRGVEADYTNPSAHLFLANSFDALRDPRRVVLRYETAWFNEQLLASLLAPVGGGPLSQFVSQLEYSKLLESDGVGASAMTEYWDNGYIDHQTAVFWTRGRFSTGLDFAYNREKTTTDHTATSRRRVYWQAKFEISENDLTYAYVEGQRTSGGDRQGSAGLHAESQNPGLALVGFNHRWAPGVHTLFLGGRLGFDEKQEALQTPQSLVERAPGTLPPEFFRTDPAGRVEFASPELRGAVPPALGSNPDGSLRWSKAFEEAVAPFLGQGAITNVVDPDPRFDFATRRRFQAFSAEIQQLWQQSHNTTIVGSRFQRGSFNTYARLDLRDTSLIPLFPSPAALQDTHVDFQRSAVYAYDFYRLSHQLTLLLGATWDSVARPENFRKPPVSQRQTTSEKLSGKIGLTYTPSPLVTMRAAHSEALGGVTFDESVRLEPVQFGGLIQVFRTAISESVIGSVEAPRYRTTGASIEGSLPTRTWWAAAFNRLDEDATQTGGVFEFLSAPVFPNGAAFLPSSAKKSFAYRERVFTANLDQLVGNEFTVGVAYRLMRPKLAQRIPDMSAALADAATNTDWHTLHHVQCHLNWNSPSGPFGRVVANGYWQAVRGINSVLVTQFGDDHSWQFDTEIGRRFRRNRCAISCGILNAGNTAYRASPLVTVINLPERRRYFARFRIGF